MNATGLKSFYQTFRTNEKTKTPNVNVKMISPNLQSDFLTEYNFPSNPINQDNLHLYCFLFFDWNRPP